MISVVSMYLQYWLGIQCTPWNRILFESFDFFKFGKDAFLFINVISTIIDFAVIILKSKLNKYDRKKYHLLWGRTIVLWQKLKNFWNVFIIYSIKTNLSSNGHDANSNEMQVISWNFKSQIHEIGQVHIFNTSQMTAHLLFCKEIINWCQQRRNIMEKNEDKMHVAKNNDHNFLDVK